MLYQVYSYSIACCLLWTCLVFSKYAILKSEEFPRNRYIKEMQLRVLGRWGKACNFWRKHQSGCSVNLNHALKMASVLREAFKDVRWSAASQKDACNFTDAYISIILSLDYIKIFLFPFSSACTSVASTDYCKQCTETLLSRQDWYGGFCIGIWR